MPHRPRIDRRNGVVIVSPTRDIDIATADEFVEITLGAVPNDAQGVIADLSGARYIDSAGIRALFAIADALRRRRQSFQLVVPPEAAARRVIGIVGLDAAGEIFESLADALGSQTG